MIYIVIPCYNEQDVLDQCAHDLEKVFYGIPSPMKILFVDDGSYDRTWNVIVKLSQEKCFISGLRLSHNVGQQTAIWAGMEACVDEAEAIITMDADLQTDISILPEMIIQFHGGADIVMAVKRGRSGDNWLKRWIAQVYYRLVSVLGCKVVYNHADYRLFSQRTARALLKFPERNLYLRGLVPLLGFETRQVYFDVSQRCSGKSKYTLSRMFNLALDGVTNFSVRPLRWVFLSGSLSVLVALVVITLTLCDYAKGNVVRGWTSLLISIWLLAGWLLMALGIVGEYVGKILVEVKHRPRYFIMDTT